MSASALVIASAAVSRLIAALVSRLVNILITSFRCSFSLL
nr:MAG TPA: hypothetical protein [Caudoviricetes sp.]